MRACVSPLLGLSFFFTLLSSTGVASAQAPPAATPNFPEPIIHFTVQSGQTCEDVANAVYKTPRHINLLHRYNGVLCNGPLKEGTTLILPKQVTSVQSATTR